MYYVVFDTEATGLERLQGPLSRPASVTKMGAEIIQIGGLFLDDNMNPYKGFCHYCDCLNACSSAEAFKVHQIRIEDIRDTLSGVFVEEVIARWLPEFYDDNIVFIGYNTPFDISMVSQGVRDFPVQFKSPRRVITKMPATGRHFIDVMDYLASYKIKLASYETQLKDKRDEFMSLYGRAVTVESNIPSLYKESWEKAHNSLYDSINTYLLFRDRVWQRKILRGGMRG